MTKANGPTSLPPHLADTLVVLATLGANAAHWTVALDHLYAWAGLPVELFIALDEPSDGQVQTLVNKATHYPKIRCVSVDASPKRRGLVHAYNAGFAYFHRAPHLRYLHLLEEGVRVTVGWDTAMRRTLEAHPSFGWVACGQIENPSAPFTALCSLLTREAVLKVQGLDEDFAPDQFDDGDLFMRLRAAGYTPHAIPHRISHPQSRTSRYGNFDEDVARMRNHQQLFAVRHGLPDMPWASVPVHAECDRCRVVA